MAADGQPLAARGQIRLAADNDSTAQACNQGMMRWGQTIDLEADDGSGRDLDDDDHEHHFRRPYYFPHPPPPPCCGDSSDDCRCRRPADCDGVLFR
jgi:hypothetical protein